MTETDCTCGNARVDRRLGWTPDQCKACWLRMNGGKGIVKPAKPAPGPCGLQGSATGETIRCETCRGRVELKVFACGAHGRCTIGPNAAGLASCPCPDHVPKER